MSDIEVNAALRTIIQTLMEMPDNSVRPSHQNAPIYKGEEYITVQILSEVAEGTDDTQWIDIAGENLYAMESLSGVRITSVAIQYYNGAAFDRLRSLASRLQSYMGTQYLEDAGFGYIVVSGLQDIAALLPDSEWQSRATMRFDFYSERKEEIKIPLIVVLPPITTTLNVGLTTESEGTIP